MEERGAIQRRTRAEVESVCAESSLSPQQRQQKIRQIHEQAKQEMDALVTPQQMEALKSCLMSRNHGGGRTGVAHPSAGEGHGCSKRPFFERKADLGRRCGGVVSGFSSCLSHC